MNMQEIVAAISVALDVPGAWTSEGQIITSGPEEAFSYYRTVGNCRLITVFGRGFQDGTAVNLTEGIVCRFTPEQALKARNQIPTPQN